MINLEVVGLIVFFSIVGILILIDRKNIKFYYGIVMRRWKFQVELIDRIVSKHRKILYWIGNVAIVLSLLAGLIGVGGLIYSIIVRQEAMLVLPTTGSFKYPGPVLSVPFWYWIVTIFVMITVHEGMHALFARLSKIPIKEAGLITLLVFPIGAFVEPDMKKVKKLKLLEKLRIYAGGSFGNLIVVGVTLLLLFASTWLFGYLAENVGIKIGSSIENTPAFEAGVKGILYRINDYDVKGLEDLVNFMKQVKVGDDLVLYTTEGTYRIKTVSHPKNESMPYMGIANLTNVYMYKRVFSGYVSESSLNIFRVWINLLIWIFILNIAVATINMLPLRPLDGGLSYEEILKKKFGKKGKKIMRIIEILTLGLLLFSIFGVYGIKMLT